MFFATLSKYFSSANKDIIVIVRFLPIINYSIEEGLELDAKLLEALYQESCENLSKNFDEVEISTSSYGFWDNFKTILEFTKCPAFGSINSTEIAIKLLAKLDPKQNYKFFAPAYDDEVASLLKDYPNIEYIPGIFLEEEYDEVSHYSSVKIFPYQVNDVKDMIDTLSAPYPEFREKRYRDKVLLDASNPHTYVISSPRDYQKIRKKFLNDPSCKISILIKQKNCHELANKITKLKYISRINFDQCTYTNAIVSTRVFTNVIKELNVIINSSYEACPERSVGKAIQKKISSRLDSDVAHYVRSSE